MANINYPFGNPSIFIVPGSASTYEYTIFNDYTIIDAKSVACTKARVLKLKFSVHRIFRTCPDECSKCKDGIM